MTDTLRARLETRATELGFVRLGVARVEAFGREDRALREWIAKGHHASMGWMERTRDVRLDVTHEGMLKSARSVIVLVTPYGRSARPGDAGEPGPAPGVVAKYARGRDYHNVVGKRMRKLAALLGAAGFSSRASVDSLPVLERAWAQRAGVGFVGKNCCLIVPGVGSHVFLSALVTDAELPYDAPMPERCGGCRLCLDACPTEAFVKERELDAARCISYLTIEHREPIAEALRAPIGAHVFGCDDCQDVCPFNRTAPPSADLTEPFARDPRLDVPLEALLTMDEAAHREWAHGSPLRRAGRDGLARNAALVLGNVGGRRHLPVLRERAANDPSDMVRDAAAWAAARISDREGDA